MPSLVYDLPQELWIEIFENLSYEDLLRLRLCCKTLNETVSLDWIWGQRCMERWVKSDAEDVLAQKMDGNESLVRKGSWFYYFRLRNRMDRHALNTMQKLKNCLEEGTYWSKMEHLLKCGPMIIQLLKKLEAKGYESTTPFEITYLSRQVLLTMRHMQLFDYIDSASNAEAAEWVHYAEETVFLPLCAMDPAFNRLLPFRSKIMKQVHTQVEQNFEDLSQFMLLPSTLRLDKLMKYLFDALEKNRLDHVRQHTRYYLDDFMLLRVYSGEAKGHPLVLLSIIQAVAERYEVECALCEKFLIVRDDRIRNGETYVTITQTGSPRIFTRKNLVSSMCRIFPSRDVVISSVIPKLLQPLRTRDILLKIFDEWSPYCKKSYWNTVSERTTESLSRHMPHSRFPICIADYEYFQAYWKIKSLASQTAFRNWDQGQFLKFVESQHPHDKLVVEKRIESEVIPTQPFKTANFPDSFYEKHFIHKNTTNLLGRIVTDKRLHENCIILGARSTEDGSEYLTLMDALGEIKVLHKDDVERVELNSLSPEDVKSLINKLSLSDLGLFFTSFNFDTYHFIPSEMFRRYLVNDST